jgi:hypothetical protein
MGKVQVEGSSKHGNEPSDSIKCWEFRDKLSNDHLLKKYRAPSNPLSDKFDAVHDFASEKETAVTNYRNTH